MTKNSWFSYSSDLFLCQAPTMCAHIDTLEKGPLHLNLLINNHQCLIVHEACESFCFKYKYSTHDEPATQTDSTKSQNLPMIWTERVSDKITLRNRFTFFQPFISAVKFSISKLSFIYSFSDQLVSHGKKQEIQPAQVLSPSQDSVLNLTFSMHNTAHKRLFWICNLSEKSWKSI